MIPKQQTFDTVVAYLRKQGRKAIHEGKCMYRAPNGDRCAAGCLIPDSQYHPDMEGLACFHTTVWPALHEHDITLVESLQDTHDHRPVPAWEEEWKALAEQHRLVYTPPGD